MFEDEDIAARILAAVGPTKAPDTIRRLLAAKRIHVLDTVTGRRLVDASDYELNMQILVGVTARVGTIPLPQSPDVVATFLATTEIASDEGQIAAFAGAIQNRICIIEGPPGTGKSTLASVIARWLMTQEEGRLVVAAFSARIKEKTAKRCQAPGYTLHQLTQTVPGEEHVWSGRRIDDEITTIIVDEAFAMGPLLLNRVLRMAHASCRIILIGDPRQMPPIERGRSLHDLHDTGIVPVYRLSTSHRMGHDSHLSNQAARIAQGLMPRQGPGLRIRTSSTTGPSSDQAKAELAATLFKGSRRSGRSTVVITPHQYGAAGHVAINRLITGDTGIAIGDEIITTEARRKKWQNGEMATVVDQTTDDLTLMFQDGRKVVVPRDENAFVLAYAISGHRSQGLEYDREILVLASSGSKMVTREFLVAAFSRARDVVVLTDPGIIEAGIRRHEINTRPAILRALVDARKA